MDRSQSDRVRIANHALKMLETGDIFGSMLLALKGLQKYPYDEPLLSHVGRGYLNMNLYYRALPYYIKLVELKPENTDYLMNLSTCYLMLKMFSEAEEVGQKLLELDSNNYEIYFQVGNIYEHSYQYQSALKFFQKSTQLNKKFERAYKGVVRTLSNLGRYQELTEALKKVSKQDKDIGKQYQSYCKNHEATLTKMIEELFSWLNKLPVGEEQDWGVQLVNLLHQNKELMGEAVRGTLLELAIHLRPDMYHIEFIYNEEGLQPETSEDILRRMFLLGRAIDHLGDAPFAKIKDHYPVKDPHRFVPSRKSSDRFAYVELEDIPQQRRNVFMRAKLMLAEGQPLAALLTLDLLLEEEPDLGPALLYKIRTLMELERYTEALSVVYHSLSLRSEDSHVIAHAIQICEKLEMKEDEFYFLNLLNSVEETEENRRETSTGTSRSTSVNTVARKSTGSIHRYQLPRSIWNMAMQGYSNLLSGNSHFAEMMYSILSANEPHYLEGRMAQAAYHLTQGETEEVNAIISEVRAIDPNYAYIEVIFPEEGAEIPYNPPVMVYDQYLPREFYCNLPVKVTTQQSQGIQGGQPNNSKTSLKESTKSGTAKMQKFCIGCGTKRGSPDQNFCTKCGKKFDI